MKNKILILVSLAVLLSLHFVSAEVSGCCERTNNGFYCQNVLQSECTKDVLPTSCDSASFCKGKYCFNSVEGTCISNTPEIVCNAKGGVSSETFPPQCELGCCVLGDQASFVTLTRCKRLSSFLGLQTNFKKNIENEVACVLTSLAQVKGACVYEEDFEKTCRVTTQADCNALIKGEFYEGKLCSAEELGTNCGPTEQTKCLPGKDGVYFVDSCGNAANIYDKNKVSDKEYWGNIKTEDSSCNSDSNNANSKTCGNCNYLLGSICREATSGNRPDYGANICTDLNCKDETGKARIHGESWCTYGGAGEQDSSDNTVGSRYYRYICMNGEVVSETCEDYRQEVCIQADTPITGGRTFSQAACRVNRWRDCTFQTEKDDCENTDKRDCVWYTAGANNQKNLGALLFLNSSKGACLPLNSPGLKFWEGDDAKVACGIGTAVCSVVYEKGLLSDYSPKQNAECLEEGWTSAREKICQSLGDCGIKSNWLDAEGYETEYDIKYVPETV